MKKYQSILFGLTADPIHKGHEQAVINGVEYLRDNGFKIKQFILVPVYQPNLIAGKKAPIAGFDQRIQMCQIVMKRLSQQLDCSLLVSDIEKQIAQSSGKNNYSLNTLKQFGLKNCLFMVSADHFQGRWPKFRKWFGWKEILNYSGLLINQRPGHKINKNFIAELKSMNPDIFLVDNQPSIEISSSKIRANYQRSQTNSLLSKDIRDYIEQHNLYQSP